MSKYFVDAAGVYIGGFDGAEPPEDAVEVPAAPIDARQIWDGKAWGAVPVDLMVYAADKRWQVETGGITVAGASVATDDRSKTLIMGARMKADRDATFTTKFKGASGEFMTVDASMIIAISDALLDHVDACFRAEDAVQDEITGGTITTTAEIDAVGWPA